MSNFGGTGGIAKCVRRCGFEGRLWDIAVNPRLDLKLFGQGAAYPPSDGVGEVTAIMLAKPCTSWPIARHRTTVFRRVMEPRGHGPSQ